MSLNITNTEAAHMNIFGNGPDAATGGGQWHRHRSKWHVINLVSATETTESSSAVRLDRSNELSLKKQLDQKMPKGFASRQGLPPSALGCEGRHFTSTFTLQNTIDA